MQSSRKLEKRIALFHSSATTLSLSLSLCIAPQRLEQMDRKNRPGLIKLNKQRQSHHSTTESLYCKSGCKARKLGTPGPLVRVWIQPHLPGRPSLYTFFVPADNDTSILLHLERLANPQSSVATLQEISCARVSSTQHRSHNSAILISTRHFEEVGNFPHFPHPGSRFGIHQQLHERDVIAHRYVLWTPG